MAAIINGLGGNANSCRGCSKPVCCSCWWVDEVMTSTLQRWQGSAELPYEGYGATAYDTCWTDGSAFLRISSKKEIESVTETHHTWREAQRNDCFCQCRAVVTCTTCTERSREAELQTLYSARMLCLKYKCVDRSSYLVWAAHESDQPNVLCRLCGLPIQLRGKEGLTYLQSRRTYCRDTELIQGDIAAIKYYGTVSMGSTFIAASAMPYWSDFIRVSSSTVLP